MVGSPAYNVCAEEEDGRERAGIPQQAGQSDLQGDNAHDYPFREWFVAHELRNLQRTRRDLKHESGRDYVLRGALS